MLDYISKYFNGSSWDKSNRRSSTRAPFCSSPSILGFPSSSEIQLSGNQEPLLMTLVGKHAIRKVL